MSAEPEVNIPTNHHQQQSAAAEGSITPRRPSTDSTAAAATASEATPTSTRVTTKNPPTTAVHPPPVNTANNNPTATSTAAPAATASPISSRLQLKRPTTNIRPVHRSNAHLGPASVYSTGGSPNLATHIGGPDSATSGASSTSGAPHVAAAAGSGTATSNSSSSSPTVVAAAAAANGRTRRAFPPSPTMAGGRPSVHHQPPPAAAGAERKPAVPGQHVDPVVGRRTGATGVATMEELTPVYEFGSPTTTTTTGDSRPLPTATRGMRIIGRPSIAGQRSANSRAAHPSNATRALNTTPVRPTTKAAATAGGAGGEKEGQSHSTATARRRSLVGAQRNSVHTNPFTAATATAVAAGGGAAVDEHLEAGVTASIMGSDELDSASGPPSNSNNIMASQPMVLADLTRPASGDGYRHGLRPSRQHRLIQTNAHNPHKIVNCFSTKYPIVRRIAHELDFEVQETEEEFGAYQFNLCWSDTVLPLTKLVRLGNWQRSNHFPSMYLLCRKGHLGTTLGRLRRQLPTHYAFYPHTWSMRTERTTFQRYRDALKQRKMVRYFIMKPNSGCQGRGIIVSRDPLSELVDVDNYIVQEYVHRPLLLEGKKFDLRVYVLLTSIREPSIFIFNDGLVRVCTESYEAPNDENVKNSCKHLTNYALNKHSTEYVFNTDVAHGDVGNKRNFRFLNRWLEGMGHSTTKFWDEVGFIIVKSILTAQPQIAQIYNSCFPRYNEGYTCFEVLGFDVLIDHKMKPWLMEVNHTPSFMTDTPLDLDIKSKLMRETWEIMDCKATDQQRDRQRERVEFAKRNMPPWMSNHPLYTSSSLSTNSAKPAAAAGGGGGDGTDQQQRPPSAVPDTSESPNAIRVTTTGSRASYVVSPTISQPANEAEAFRAMIAARRGNEDSKLKNFTRAYPTENENFSIVYETIRNLGQSEWAIPETTAGFTVNGNPYSSTSGGGGGGFNRDTYATQHHPFMTASGTPMTPAQQQQSDRIRKDLRDIATGNYNATTGTGRNATTTIPVGPRPPRTGRPGSKAAAVVTSPGRAMPAASPTTASAMSPTATGNADPSSASAAAATSPNGTVAGQFKMLEEDLLRGRQQRNLNANSSSNSNVDMAAAGEAAALESTPVAGSMTPKTPAAATAAATPATAITSGNDTPGSPPSKAATRPTTPGGATGTTTTANTTAATTPTIAAGGHHHHRQKSIPALLVFPDDAAAPASSSVNASRPTSINENGATSTTAAAATAVNNTANSNGKNDAAPARSGSVEAGPVLMGNGAIKPTEEELALLDRLQMDLDEAAEADPEPLTEDSVDLE